ncbi:MAG TPA: ABC-2 family transporter protein [Phycisphaerae bacterium]|nr:ABC-2 family transporter protein [Phycisphaerae bacterium]
MRAYWAIFSARFRGLLQYRAAALAGLGTQLFWGLIRVMIFGAFYASSRRAAPMTFEQVVTYVWLGQGMIRLLIWRGDPAIEEMIRTGTVAYELTRPLELYWLWFSRSAANVTAPTVLRAVPMYALALALLGMQAPASLAAGGAWVVATAMAATLTAAMCTLVSISLMWTISGEGLSRLLPAAVWCLSGMVIPLPFFPDWAQPVLNALPFRAMMDVPFRIYVGHIGMSEWAAALGHQAAWTIGVVLLGRWVISRGTRRLVVQGG